MPTRRRGPGDGPLKPSVLHFLATGEMAMAEKEISPWVYFSLSSPPAIEARRLWAAGDVDGALAALRKSPAAHNLFRT